MRLSWWFLAGALASVGVAAPGCTTGIEMPHRDGGSGMDGAIDSGPAMPDAGRSCTTDVECDDTFACTIDQCGVGNRCSYTALDTRCMAGERCVVGVGCRTTMPSACETAAECDDGDFCNGMEDCIGPAGSRTCVMGPAADCDDGNTCTVDACDPSPAINGCTYSSAPGCDGGAITFDGGLPCDAFMSSDYAGTFSFRPSALSACVMSGTYNISEVTISVSGGTLSVRADRFTLTQSPAPTDGSFDVSFSDSCVSIRLVGSFACADRWSGTWTATFGGSCSGLCTNQTLTVRGSRR